MAWTDSENGKETQRRLRNKQRIQKSKQRGKKFYDDHREHWKEGFSQETVSTNKECMGLQRRLSDTKPVDVNEIMPNDERFHYLHQRVKYIKFHLARNDELITKGGPYHEYYEMIESVVQILANHPVKWRNEISVQLLDKIDDLNGKMYAEESKYFGDAFQDIGPSLYGKQFVDANELIAPKHCHYVNCPNGQCKERISEPIIIELDNRAQEVKCDSIDGCGKPFWITRRIRAEGSPKIELSQIRPPEPANPPLPSSRTNTLIEKIQPRSSQSSLTELPKSFPQKGTPTTTTTRESNTNNKQSQTNPPQTPPKKGKHKRIKLTLNKSKSTTKSSQSKKEASESVTPSASISESVSPDQNPPQNHRPLKRPTKRKANSTTKAKTTDINFNILYGGSGTRLSQLSQTDTRSCDIDLSNALPEKHQFFTFIEKGTGTKKYAHCTKRLRKPYDMVEMEILDIKNGKRATKKQMYDSNTMKEYEVVDRNKEQWVMQFLSDEVLKLHHLTSY